MTELTAPVLTPAPIAPPLHTSPVTFPLGWLLQHASPAIQYRSLVDVARLGATVGPRLADLPYAQRSTLVLAVTQRGDGVWHNAMLSLPPARSESFDHVGTIVAARRLLESGLDKDSPPLVRARRLLFRLLAEDDDRAFLFEFAGSARDDDLSRRGRAILREAAAATLAQAGYEGDPRLRGAAQRIVNRIDNFLRSPLGQRPWVRVGNKHVLANEAAPPSIYALTMLAFMPLFRNECSAQIDRIFHHVSQPLPRQEAQQLCGETIVSQQHLVLGDWFPSRNAADADVPGALFWLELMARLGYLRRSDTWSKVLERMLDERDRDFVWRGGKGAPIARPHDAAVWPIFPIDEHPTGDGRWTDVTFRLGLIARLAGRPIELV